LAGEILDAVDHHQRPLALVRGLPEVQLLEVGVVAAREQARAKAPATDGDAPIGEHAVAHGVEPRPPAPKPPPPRHPPPPAPRTTARRVVGARPLPAAAGSGVRRAPTRGAVVARGCTWWGGRAGLAARPASAGSAAKAASPSPCASAIIQPGNSRSCTAARSTR